MITKLDRLIASINSVLREKSGSRVNGKVASNRTQEIALQVMTNCARRLHKLGFYLESADGLSKRHIDALVQEWHHVDKLSAKTIQNQFSRLKIFCSWIDKVGIISPLGAVGHLPGVDASALRVTTVATKSKSWSANGVDLAEKIKEASLQDQRHAAMLQMGVAFGLRKKEQLKIKLWKSDKGTHLEIDDSVAKNGKYRIIAIEQGTPEKDAFGRAQRWALDQAKSLCKKTETLGWPGLTYRQSENRYYHYMKRLGLTKFDSGVTAHGLRAEFAENLLLLGGLIPPSLGGTAAQMPKAQRDAIMGTAAIKLGHNDLHTSSAYYSSFRKEFTDGNLSGKLGRVIVVDSENDHFAVIYCNPMPKADLDGVFAPVTAEARSRTVITVVVEKPDQPDSKMSPGQFVQTYPALSQRLKAQLGSFGFTD